MMMPVYYLCFTYDGSINVFLVARQKKLMFSNNARSCSCDINVCPSCIESSTNSAKVAAANTWACSDSLCLKSSENTEIKIG